MEVLQFFDPTGSTVVARIPAQGSTDIKLGAQLIVQESQQAIFFYEGKALDVFGPGRHSLLTANVPLLTRLLTLPWDRSPFQASVYFVGRQTFLDQRWGTRQPITVRDPEFGIVRLRAFGKFAFRVVDCTTFVNGIVGTQGLYETSQVESYLRDQIVSRMTDVIGSAGFGLLDLPSKFDELAAAIRIKVADTFSRWGLELVDFFINSITPPEEVQKAIDARTSMGAIGDLHSYMLYQTAGSLAKLSESKGEAGGALQAGLGAGLGMMIPSMIGQSMRSAGQRPVAGAQGANANAMPTFGLSLDALGSGTSDPRQLVREAAALAGWSLNDSLDTWTITVPVSPLRKQLLRVNFNDDGSGHAVIAISSVCGPFQDKSAAVLLEYNSQLVHGAFAVESSDSGKQIVMRTNLLSDATQSFELTRAMTSIAWQADQVEEKLSGTDVF